MDEAIVGRDAELESLERFLAADGVRGLVLEGEPGIGKTTLWSVGLDMARARSDVVLSCRAGESEAKLSYSGLRDLLRLLLDGLALLPEPQREALEVALLARAGSAADAGAVSAAALALVQGAAVSPLVLAVDDLPWLDRASARAPVRRATPRRAVCRGARDCPCRR